MTPFDGLSFSKKLFTCVSFYVSPIIVNYILLLLFKSNIWHSDFRREHKMKHWKWGRGFLFVYHCVLALYKLGSQALDTE